jgi:PEP-CTERM motif
MNRITLRSLIAVPVLLVFLCAPSITSADPITWTLSGVTFDDGGTASGSFVFDATTSTLSSISIVTTAGTTSPRPGTPFGGTAYTGVNTGAPSGFPPLSFDIAVVPDVTIDLTGSMVLDLELPMPGLTDSGGTVSLLAMTAAEDICSNSDCSVVDDSPFRFAAGELVSPVATTPEPSAFLLLGMGLVCLAGVAKRKVFQG